MFVIAYLLLGHLLLFTCLDQITPGSYLFLINLSRQVDQMTEIALNSLELTFDLSTSKGHFALSLKKLVNFPYHLFLKDRVQIISDRG